MLDSIQPLQPIKLANIKSKLYLTLLEKSVNLDDILD